MLKWAVILAMAAAPLQVHAEVARVATTKGISEALTTGCVPATLGLLEINLSKPEIVEAAGLRFGGGSDTSRAAAVMIPGGSAVLQRPVENGLVLLGVRPGLACRLAVFDTDAAAAQAAIAAEFTAPGAPWKLTSEKKSDGEVVRNYEWPLAGGGALKAQTGWPTPTPATGLQAAITIYRVK